jgi:hypothetical protein
MPLVSITRPRVRSWRYLPAFFVATFRSALQARWAKGNLAVSILREAHNTFWTRSLWNDEAAMKSFMVSGAHRTIMPKLLEWCDEASLARWTQNFAQKPHMGRGASVDAARRSGFKGQPSIGGSPPLRPPRSKSEA